MKEQGFDLQKDIGKIENVKMGDRLLASGVLYTVRDKVHRKISDRIRNKESLPFDIKNSTVYYCGPSPKPDGKIVGACGPTTSKRMDRFTPLLLENGLKIMIGKGDRGEEVKNAIVKNKALYLTVTGGAAALLASHVIEFDLVAFEELGPEACYRMVVVDFPCIVAIDSIGSSIYNKKWEMI